MLLTELNDDVLRHIFEQCSIEDVIRLYYVCRKFQAIVTHYTFFKKSLDLLMVGHRNSESVCCKRFVRPFSSVFVDRLSIPFNLLSEHCTICRTTNASSYSKIGATVATPSTLCSIRGNSIHRAYSWRRIYCTSRMVANCVPTNVLETDRFCNGNRVERTAPRAIRTLPVS